MGNCSKYWEEEKIPLLLRQTPSVWTLVIMLSDEETMTPDNGKEFIK